MNIDSDDDDLFKALSRNQPKKKSTKETLNILVGDDETEKDLFADDVDLFSPSSASTFSLSKDTTSHSIFTQSTESDHSFDEKDDLFHLSQDKRKESDEDDFFPTSTVGDIFGTTKPLGLDFGQEVLLGGESKFGIDSDSDDSGDDTANLDAKRGNAEFPRDDTDPGNLFSDEARGSDGNVTDMLDDPHNPAIGPRGAGEITQLLPERHNFDGQDVACHEMVDKQVVESRASPSVENNGTEEPAKTNESDLPVDDLLETSDTSKIMDFSSQEDNEMDIVIDPENKDIHHTDSSTSSIDKLHDCSEHAIESVDMCDDEHMDHAKTLDSRADEITPNQSDSAVSEEPIAKIKAASSQETSPSVVERAEESQATLVSKCPTSKAEENSQSGKREEKVEMETQEMVKCCKCDLLSLPIGEMVKKKILDLSGQNLGLEDLVAILEKESVQQRDQFTAERQKIAGLQETIFDLKAQLTEQTRISEEYQSKCQQLEESLIGTRRMVTVLEEQLSTANSYKSGVDYMLESQLAQGRMAAAEARAQAAQHELLQAQDEIKRLLDSLNKVNQEKREMVSLDVHQELMKISDDKSREMELTVLQLKSENSIMKREVEGLKEVNSKTHTPSPPLPGSQIGDWNRALLAQTMKETSEMISYKTMFSDNYMSSADAILASAHKKQPIAKPTPLVAALISDKPRDHDKKPVSEDSDSDWSSDSNTDKLNPASLPSSPVRTATDVIIEARAALHKTPTKKPPIAQKPKLAPKPGLPPKPQKPAKPAQTTKPKPAPRTCPTPKSPSEPAKAHIESPLISPLTPQEKPVSFEEVAGAPALKVIRRPQGPKGRRRPKATNTQPNNLYA